MSWLIGTLAITWALVMAYWCGREVGLRWGRAARRRAEWDRLDDEARARAIEQLNPVDPREVLGHDAA
jgi:hypothetical protein